MRLGNEEFGWKRRGNGVHVTATATDCSLPFQCQAAAPEPRKLSKAQQKKLRKIQEVKEQRAARSQVRPCTQARRYTKRQYRRTVAPASRRLMPLAMRVAGAGQPGAT